MCTHLYKFRDIELMSCTLLCNSVYKLTEMLQYYGYCVIITIARLCQYDGGQMTL